MLGKEKRDCRATLAMTRHCESQAERNDKKRDTLHAFAYAHLVGMTKRGEGYSVGMTGKGHLVGMTRAETVCEVCGDRREKIKKLEV